MSIDDRLREGLRENTDYLLPQADHELSVVMRRAHRRSRVRLAVAGVATAAVLATVGLLAGSSRVVDRIDGTVPALPVDPRPLGDYHATVEPGEYVFEVGGAGSATLPQPVVYVPAGYWNPGPYIVYAGTDDQEALGSLSFWYTSQTVDDPCHYSTSGRSALGPTTRDALTALTRRPSIRSSEPQPVTIGGHDGYYLTLQLRRTVDLAKCDDGYALLAGEDPAFVVGPDGYHLSHYWILDVDGRTIIMIAGEPAGDDPSQTAKILDLARGVYFIEPTG